MVKQFVVDTFTDQLFKGNPAAVCPLDTWLDDSVLQAIAAENNLSETAFFVPVESVFHLRWFTPTVEIDLCGHATLASAHVLFEHLAYQKPQIHFMTRSGELTVSRQGQWLDMVFPASIPEVIECPDLLVKALGKQPIHCLAAEDYLVVLASEEEVRQLTPDFALLVQLDRRGVIVTAQGQDVDFVSRFFAPRVGINEDPVTGSAHCQLAPYWAQQLGKTKLEAMQVSARGGVIRCTWQGDKVVLAGQAVTFMQGALVIQSPPIILVLSIMGVESDN